MRSLYRSLTSMLHRYAAVIAIAFAVVPLGAATHSYIAATATAASGASFTPSFVSPSSSNLFTINSQWSTLAQNTRLSSISTLAANGFLDFQSGAQPANANGAVTGTQLCTVQLGATAFKAPASGSMASNGALSCTGTAGATGSGTTAGYVVLYKSDHTSVIWMGSVGTSAANVVMPTTTISTGLTVSLADGALVINDNAAISGQ